MSNLPILRICSALAIAGLLTVSSSRAAQQDKGKLAAARSIKCAFSAMALGSWGKEQAEAKIKPATLTLQFDAINTDEGSAELRSSFGGKYDIVVRYAEGYLHFIQSFLD